MKVAAARPSPQQNTNPVRRSRIRQGAEQGKLNGKVAFVTGAARGQGRSQEGVSSLGRLDIVCAKAGVNVGSAPAHLVEDDIWDATINLSGVWRTCKAAIPPIIEGGRDQAEARRRFRASLPTGYLLPVTDTDCRSRWEADIA